MSSEKKDIGKRGEKIAVTYLQHSGYTILEQNYHCKLGEIDIIAYDHHILVFLEVRTKSSLDFGLPQESINLKKQHQISKVALEYISRKKLKNIPARFDVIAISLSEGKEKLEHIKDAFELRY